MSVIAHYCICDKGLNCSIIQSALKLQELVKKETKQSIDRVATYSLDHDDHHNAHHDDQILAITLQSLLEESEK